MAPKLHLVYSSPPVRAVLMLDEALKLGLEHVELGFGDFRKPEFLKINPQHTVPTLVDDDGTVVVDSHAIMIYLIEKYRKGNSFYPNDIEKKAVINARLFFEVGTLFPIVKRIGLAARTMSHRSSTDLISEKLKQDAEAAYHILNEILKDHEWVAGNEITIADFSLIPTVTSVGHFIPIDSYPNVTRWIQRAQMWTYYEPNRRGLELLDGLVQQMMKQQF